MYDRLVRTIIPAVVAHIEDTYDSYDVEKVQISSMPCYEMNVTKFADRNLDANFILQFNYAVFANQKNLYSRY